MTAATGTLHEELRAFMTTYRSILLRIRNALDKICRQNRNKHLSSITFFFENHAIYVLMRKNMKQPGRTGHSCQIIRRKPFAY